MISIKDDFVQFLEISIMTLLGPENIPLELQNADLLAPPTTDNG